MTENYTSKLIFKEGSLEKINLEEYLSSLKEKQDILPHYTNIAYLIFDSQQWIDSFIDQLNLKQDEQNKVSLNSLNSLDESQHLYIITSQQLLGKILILNPIAFCENKGQISENILELHRYFIKKSDQILYFCQNYQESAFHFLFEEMITNKEKDQNDQNDKQEDEKKVYFVNNTGNGNIDIVNSKKFLFNFDLKQLGIIYSQDQLNKINEYQQSKSSYQKLDIQYTKYDNELNLDYFDTLEKILIKMQGTIPIPNSFILTLLQDRQVVIEGADNDENIKKTICSYEFQSLLDEQQKALELKINKHRNTILQNSIFEFINLQLIKEELIDKNKEFWGNNVFLSQISKNLGCFKKIIEERLQNLMELSVQKLFKFQIWNIKKKLQKSFLQQLETVMKDYEITQTQSNKDTEENIYKIVKQEKINTLVNIKKNFLETFENNNNNDQQEENEELDDANHEQQQHNNIFANQIDIDETLEEIELILNKIIVHKLKEYFQKNVQKVFENSILKTWNNKIFHLFIKGDIDFNIKVKKMYENELDKWSQLFRKNLIEQYNITGKQNQDLIEKAQQILYKGICNFIVEFLKPQPLIARIREEYPDVKLNFQELRNLMRDIENLKLIRPSKQKQRQVIQPQNSFLLQKQGSQYLQVPESQINQDILEKMKEEGNNLLSDSDISLESIESISSLEQENTHKGKVQFVNSSINASSTQGKDKLPSSNEKGYSIKVCLPPTAGQQENNSSKKSLSPKKQKESAFKMKQLINKRVAQLELIEQTILLQEQKIKSGTVIEKIELQVKKYVPNIDLQYVRIRENVNRKDFWGIYGGILLLFWSLNHFSLGSSFVIFLLIQILMLILKI